MDLCLHPFFSMRCLGSFYALWAYCHCLRESVPQAHKTPKCYCNTWLKLTYLFNQSSIRASSVHKLLVNVLWWDECLINWGLCKILPACLHSEGFVSLFFCIFWHLVVVPLKTNLSRCTLCTSTSTAWFPAGDLCCMSDPLSFLVSCLATITFKKYIF